MEVTIDLEKVVGSAVVALILYALIMWIGKGWNYLTGILKERGVSKKALRSKRRQEAQALSDGATQLLDAFKQQGLLNDAGYKFWQRRLRGIGLTDVGEEASFGKPWHFKATHAMRELKNRLLSRKLRAEEATSQEKISEMFAHLKK